MTLISSSLIIKTAIYGPIIFLGVKLFMWIFPQLLIRKTLREYWPSAKCHWFWGHMLIAMETIKNPGLMIENSRSLGERFTHGAVLFIGPLKTFLRVFHPLPIRTTLGGSEKKFPKSGYEYELLIPWLGKGLLVLGGKEWQRHRKLLTNSFHWDILRPYAEKMNECSQILVEKWRNKTRSGKPSSVEVFHDYSLMTIDVIMQCLMGFESNCQHKKGEHRDYITCIQEISSQIVQRFRSTSVMMRLDFVYGLTANGKKYKSCCQRARSYVEKVIDKRKSEYGAGVVPVSRDLGFNKKNQRNFDFLDILLQAKDSSGEGLTNLEISDEVNTFMFEGHDTTTSAISWMSYCMALSPTHQQKCYEEIVKVLGSRSFVEWEDLSKFEYLTLCIKESMRMYPPVPSIARVAGCNFEVDGKHVRRNTKLLVSILGLHFNPDIWPNPHEFDPLRFTPENSKGRDPHAYIPFSAGIRNCIGQNFAMNEIKICMAHVIQNFALSLDETQPVEDCIELIYRAKGGLHLLISPRQI